jgi:DNA-binding NarL/FixJ family response regulator
MHPDVVVMDVTMPGLNGFQATQNIKECCPATSVVVLTRHTHEAYVHEFLRAGASGYVLKQSRSTELLRAVHAVSGGATYVDPALTATMTTPMRGTLSPREEQVMRLVALGHSNKEIGATLNVSVKTVEAHKANAGQKLGLASRADVVRYAHMRGWLTDL